MKLRSEGGKEESKSSDETAEDRSQPCRFAPAPRNDYRR